MEPSILIVDDDPGIRSSMSDFIEFAGYRSLKAEGAYEAIELLKNNHIDVVVTDIMMPGMNGLELTDIIKKDYDSEVIVITGYSGDFSYVDAIGKGASDFIFKPFRLEELLLRLKRVLRERQFAKERYLMLGKLEKLAITDSLTNLYNSRYFHSQLELETDRASRYKRPLSILFMDIDHFKEYNDTYGHLEGDKALLRIGQVISSCLRIMDSAHRYGGEEFTVLLPETTGRKALSVAKRIRIATENQVFNPVPGKPVSLSVSIGVTQYCNNEDVTAFVQRADKAMYQSKQKGRNRVTSIFIKESVKAKDKKC
ncbi:MAG: diguanylate cyclase [Desulfobacteraceae bacterium]|nr:MAG: diguanylate cyclase [Desulfobacteraceae bacterium]